MCRFCNGNELIYDQMNVCSTVYYLVVWFCFFWFYGQKFGPLVFYLFGPLDWVVGPSLLLTLVKNAFLAISNFFCYWKNVGMHSFVSFVVLRISSFWERPSNDSIAKEWQPFKMECYATPWQLWRAVIYNSKMWFPLSLFSLSLCLFELNDCLPARAKRGMAIRLFSINS